MNSILILTILISILDLVLISLIAPYELRRKFPDIQLFFCLFTGYGSVILCHFLNFPYPDILTGLSYGILLLAFYRIPLKEACCCTLHLSLLKSFLFLLCFKPAFPLMILKEVIFLILVWILFQYEDFSDTPVCIMIGYFVLYLMTHILFAFSCSGILVLLFMIVFYLLMLSLHKLIQKQQTLLHELIKEKNRMDIQGHYLEQQHQIMKNFHKEKHDLLERIQLCRILLSNQKQEELNTLLDTMTQHIYDIRLEEYTTMISIDSVLSYYRQSYPDILFQIDCDCFSTIPLSDYDVSTLCINTLKNAVEESQQIQNAIIHIHIKHRFDHFYLNIENSYCPTHRKEDHQGLGFSILDDIVQRYHGTYEVTKQSPTFSIEFFFPLGQKATE